MVQQQSQLIQKAAQEVQQDKAASDVAKANVEKAVANLKTAEAQFETKVAKAMADLERAKADLAIKGVQATAKDSELNHREERVKMTETGIGEIDGIKQAVGAIDGFLAQYIEASERAKAQIVAEIQRPKPRLVSSTMKRDGGSMIAEALYDDGTKKRIKAERQNGALVAVPVEETPSVQ
jgi:hypothetical protein